MHVDRDDLALRALGEHVGDAAHLEQCEDCRAELASLSVVVQVLRSAGPLEETVVPDRVWDAVVAGIERDQPAGDAPGEEGPTGLAGLMEGRGRREEGDVTPMRRRHDGPRRWPTGALLAACAAGALVAGLATSLWPSGTGSGDRLADVELVALSTDLEPAVAQLVQRDGRTVLQVEAQALPDVGDGYLEVWLLEPDISGFVTVGLLDSTTQDFVLPASLDVAAYPIVDVSHEHFDGDPAHSGQSLWRGELTLEG